MFARSPALERRGELRRIGVVRIDAPADLARQEAGDHRAQERRGQHDPDRDRPPESQASTAAGTSPTSVNRNIASR